MSHSETAPNPNGSSTDKSPTLVVGIGASAGGLEAIERFFDRMPTDSGMAFVLVQHLSPDYKSLMDEVLARWTKIPILQVENGMEVRRDSIYLIPPNKEMIVSDGHLLLMDKDPDAALSLPIDHFFRSLGQEYGTKAIAIVMSGSGSDGSRGVVEVHEAGGLVITQSAATAKFDGMPRSAEGTGITDLSLAPEEMPDAIIRYASDPRIVTEDDSLDGYSLNDRGLKQVFTLIRDKFGLDFSHYKLNTVIRRTERRLVLHKARSIDDYLERLQSDSEELNQLYRDLLIGVTRFYRDGEAFQKLQAEVIKGLVKRTPDGGELRVWVAGCATGEEAYTIAMLLDEEVIKSRKRFQVKIFATDVHPGSLEIAGQGIYPEAAMGDISPDRLARYFSRVEGGYQVSTDLRKMLVLAPHNLVKDAPFTKLDLISCRNLLIYLRNYAQQKVLSLFHFGLKPDGFLMLGPSESTGDIGEEFETIDSRWRIFRKRRDMRLPIEIRRKMMLGSNESTKATKRQSSVAGPSISDLLSMSTYDALLEVVLPTSYLVSDQGELLHTFGDAGLYLKPERGRHSNQLRDRLIDCLQAPVTTAISKTLKEDQPVAYSGVPVSREGETEATPCMVEAMTIEDPRRAVRSVLVQIRKIGNTSVTPAAHPPAGNYTDEQVSSLESELRYTKENLQATIEELETSNEELQASNEELLASNEELQSTNEELHSVNEELYTVNAEHQNKIVQLSELTRDMDSLLESTEVDTVFLDADLRIRKYTPRVAQRFNVLPQDIGREIGSFTHSIECDNLAEKIQTVVATGKVYEEEVRDDEGSCFLMRVLPYRGSTSLTDQETSSDGVLLTLIDITKLKEASDALAESVRQRDSFLAMLSHELRNPLSTIINATHLLSSANAHEANYEPVAVIQRQSQQMGTLLDDLLDVTRVSQGKIQIQRRLFNLSALVERSRESVESMLRSREQTLVVELPSEPVWVFGSEPRILQVLSNLLTNASKYSGRGQQIELLVSAEPETAVIRVVDHGEGIAPDQIDKIFELFVQADRTLDRADGGLGVGLTLVKSLVDLHDGEVTVRSEGEGQGSEFRVQLPTCDPPTETGSIPPAPQNPAGVQRLVLVEDNLDASKMLAFLLEDAGFEVSVAHDGKRGLELIKMNRPDAAIIDLGLPEIDGYQVARTLRADPAFNRMRLIAVTGYGQSRDRNESREAGYDEHLVKPVDPVALTKLLHDMPPR